MCPALSVSSSGDTCAVLGALPAAAVYPDHPVRIVVPYASGGPADVTARLLANKLQEKFGQSFVVDNRSGAGGNIGTAVGAQAAADGYTLTVITPAQIINMTLFSKPGYDLKEFAPLALLTTAPALLLANPKLGVNSVADIIAAAKAKPGAISFASQGTGVAPHLMMEMIKKAAGIDMVHVRARLYGERGSSAVSRRSALDWTLAAVATAILVWFGMMAEVPKIAASWSWMLLLSAGMVALLVAAGVGLWRVTRFS